MMPADATLQPRRHSTTACDGNLVAGCRWVESTILVAQSKPEQSWKGEEEKQRSVLNGARWWVDFSR